MLLSVQHGAQTSSGCVCDFNCQLSRQPLPSPLGAAPTGLSSGSGVAQAPCCPNQARGRRKRAGPDIDLFPAPCSTKSFRALTSGVKMVPQAGLLKRAAWQPHFTTFNSVATATVISTIAGQVKSNLFSYSEFLGDLTVALRYVCSGENFGNTHIHSEAYLTGKLNL